MMNKISSNNITSLNKNEIFVFGSNESGIHGAGAAKCALKWGAIYGKPFGLQSNTFAIPTKGILLKTLNISTIYSYINKFIEFAKEHPELKFLVTEIGCGLAGFDPSDIAPLFKECLNVDNIYLPVRFVDLIRG